MKQIFKRGAEIAMLGVLLALTFASITALSGRSRSFVAFLNAATDGVLFLIPFGMIVYAVCRFLMLLRSMIIVAALFLTTLLLCFEVMQIGFILSTSHEAIDWARRVLLLVMAFVGFEMSRRDRLQILRRNTSFFKS